MQTNILLKQLKGYLSKTKLDFVKEALFFAEKNHKNQFRKSGDPFINHPISTALYLANMKMDSTTISAALLHDVIEDCGITKEEINSKFGPHVANLVDGVTKLKIEKNNTKINILDTEELRAANVRKILTAMSDDVRVVLIKLADRLHNMLTLDALEHENQKRIAQETLDIYAPLAHRLGMWDMKWRLEDQAFKYLMPEKYKMTSRLIARKRTKRELYVNKVIKDLQINLEKSKISGSIHGRPKHLYSIFKKIEKYSHQGKKFDEIYDLIALRIIVNNISECYTTLGVVHNLWKPVPGEFDDYIANPKDSMYQSLHTTVMCFDGYPVEIQIRTEDMHLTAEEGIAAHWAYKEEDNESIDDKYDSKMNWFKQLLDRQVDVEKDIDYVDSIKKDVLGDQVFIYTPKGEIKNLPVGATPLDFAYEVHTELGHDCVSSLINGKTVSLETPLKNGDTVEIRKSKNPRGPRLDWLNPDLQFVNTSKAKLKIRQWFRKQERESNISRGTRIIKKESNKLGFKINSKEISILPGFENFSDLAEQLGSGEISIAQLAKSIEKKYLTTSSKNDQKNSSPNVIVMGFNNLPNKISKCCNPTFGQEIQGYLTRKKTVSVHVSNCNLLRYSREPERIVNVVWGTNSQTLQVKIQVDADDRIGLLRDITSVVSSENININFLQSTDFGKLTKIQFTVFTSGIEQLSRIYSRIEAISGVRNIQRLN